MREPNVRTPIGLLSEVLRRNPALLQRVAPDALERVQMHDAQLLDDAMRNAFGSDEREKKVQ